MYKGIKAILVLSKLKAFAEEQDKMECNYGDQLF
jgi:hypothetical protein